jgi:hypothetical protein
MKRIKHIELRETEAIMILTEFSFGNEMKNYGEMVESFIRSDYYLKESRTDAERENPDAGFLGIPIDVFNVFEKDFRKFDKSGINEYLARYRDDASLWSDINGSFANILNALYAEYPYFCDEQFFLIDLDWFADRNKHPDEGQDVRVNPKCFFTPYEFWFLLIWIDSKRKTLTVSEWLYD